MRKLEEFERLVVIGMPCSTCGSMSYAIGVMDHLKEGMVPSRTRNVVWRLHEHSGSSEIAIDSITKTDKGFKEFTAEVEKICGLINSGDIEFNPVGNKGMLLADLSDIGELMVFTLREAVVNLIEDFLNIDKVIPYRFLMHLDNAVLSRLILNRVEETNFKKDLMKRFISELGEDMLDDEDANTVYN